MFLFIRQWGRGLVGCKSSTSMTVNLLYCRFQVSSEEIGLFASLGVILPKKQKSVAWKEKFLQKLLQTFSSNISTLTPLLM